VIAPKQVSVPPGTQGSLGHSVAQSAW
jgi:hypothetical protein